MKLYRINRINGLLSFIPFPPNPITVEIDEKAIQIAGARRVAIPLFGIIAEEINILKRFTSL